TASKLLLNTRAGRLAAADSLPICGGKRQRPLAPAATPQDAAHIGVVAMLKLLTGAAAIAIVALPASAQTTTPPARGQVTVPSGQNSGAGIPGKPGSKSGPAAKSSPETTGSDMSDHNRAVRGQDSSKIPGQPGNKSGPSPSPPSGVK